MKWIIGFMLGLTTLSAIAATPAAAPSSAPAASSAAPAAAMSPRDMVVDTSQKMLAALKANKEIIKQNPQRVYSLVSEIVLPHFDFTTMSKWVLGKNWRKLSPAQQQRFITEFRTLLVRTYAVSLAAYKDEKLNYLPMQAPAADAQDVTVRTEVVRGGGATIPINYSLRLINGEWKVYDVVIDGVSLVVNYRTSFASQIREGGVDKLIDQLAARNQGTGS
jgi:phospholipid transport system substrate-binding protein